MMLQISSLRKFAQLCGYVSSSSGEHLALLHKQLVCPLSLAVSQRRGLLLVE